MKERVGGGEGRGLSASVSFLSSPAPPALLLAPFFELSLTLVPRSLLRNRTDTHATQARILTLNLTMNNTLCANYYQSSKKMNKLFHFALFCYFLSFWSNCHGERLL